VKCYDYSNVTGPEEKSACQVKFCKSRKENAE